MTKAYKLHIENLLTIEAMDLDLSPGIQGFVGKNAAGKTNVLTALQSILDGKHDARLIKDGEKRSVVRLEEISGDEVVASVSRIQTERNSRLDGKGLPPNTTPKKWLSTLLDEIAINPVRLISEDPVKYLKKHLPLKIQESEVIEVPTVEFSPIRFDVNAFDESDRVSEEISIARRAQYQIMRHDKEVCEELRVNLPPMPDEPERSREQLDDAKATVVAKLMTLEEQRIRRKAICSKIGAKRGYILNNQDEHEQISRSIAAFDNERERLDVARREAIRRAEEQYEREMAEVKERESVAKKSLDHNVEVCKTLRKDLVELEEQLSETPEPDESKILVEKSEIEREIQSFESYKALKQRHEHLETKQQKYHNSKDLYETLDDRFKYYAYKLPKMLIERANLPVKGLEFKEEELYVDDRHIDRLSSAERHLIAVKLAVALAKTKGHIAVCLDGIEILDDEHRKEFLDAMKDQPLKVLYTRWGQPENEHEIEVSDASI